VDAAVDSDRAESAGGVAANFPGKGAAKGEGEVGTPHVGGVPAREAGEAGPASPQPEPAPLATAAAA